MKKRQALYALIVTVILMLAAGAASAENGKAVSGDGWYFEDGILTLTRNGGWRDITEKNEINEQVHVARYPVYFGTDVKQVVIGKSVTDFDVFYHTYYPPKVLLEEGTTTYEIIDGWLINRKTDTLICAADRESFLQQTQISNLPNVVKYIGNNAFFDHRGLVSAKLPEGIMEIGECAFYWCKALESVDLPETLQTIGGYAFDGCEQLKTVQHGRQIVSIGNGAFFSCDRLSDSLLLSKIPINLVPEWCFANCRSLRSFCIPETAKAIQDYAFVRCTNLEMIVVASSNIEIGYRALGECANLKHIIFLQTPPKRIADDLFWEIPESEYEQVINRPNVVFYYLEVYAEHWSPNGETEWNGYPIQQISRAEADAMIAEATQPTPSPTAEPTEAPLVPTETPLPMPTAEPTSTPELEQGTGIDGTLLVLGGCIVAVAAAIIVLAIRRRK